MVWKINFRVASRNDLHRISRYIEKRDGSQAAEIFVSALLRKAADLVTAPHAGRPMPERRGARILVAGSYLIIYRLAPLLREVHVLRFWHGARRRRPLR